MEEPTSSTKENKMKSPCETNNRKVDKKKKHLVRASAPEQSLKETVKAKYPTLLFTTGRIRKEIQINWRIKSPPRTPLIQSKRKETETYLQGLHRRVGRI
ncbi:hypothetical protein H8957_005241, partial [Semnopithecus entellus]